MVSHTNAEEERSLEDCLLSTAAIIRKMTEQRAKEI